jgi:hypothetical protein
MTQSFEHDWPPTKKYHRRPRIETVEILPPRQPERTVRIDVNVHRRSDHNIPQLIAVGALIFLALRFLPHIGIGLLIAVALVVAYPMIGITFGFFVAVLLIAAIRNHRSGRPF